MALLDRNERSTRQSRPLLLGIVDQIGPRGV
jgi:hypothetical protein